MDTEKDFGGLLQFTNRSETPAIRDLAVRIEKVKPTARGIVDRWLAAHERSGSRR